MALETITREEFDRRLEAENARRAEEQKVTERTLARLERLLIECEDALDKIELELDKDGHQRQDDLADSGR